MFHRNRCIFGQFLVSSLSLDNDVMVKSKRRVKLFSLTFKYLTKFNLIPV